MFLFLSFPRGGRCSSVWQVGCGMERDSGVRFRSNRSTIVVFVSPDFTLLRLLACRRVVVTLPPLSLGPAALVVFARLAGFRLPPVSGVGAPLGWAELCSHEAMSAVSCGMESRMILARRSQMLAWETSAFV